MRWYLYALGVENDWHLLFIGYTLDFSKSFVEDVRWSKKIADQWYGVGYEGGFYKIIETTHG